MGGFSNWKDYWVPQRRSKTSCIAAGYEMLLRAKGAENINFDTFQDEFDLDKNAERGNFRNNFESVGKEIENKYPQVDCAWEAFDKGCQKLAKVEKLLEQGELILVSLPIINWETGEPTGYHIMPIVAWDDNYLTLVTDNEGNPKVLKYEKWKIESLHDAVEIKGGKEIAYIKNVESEKDFFV